MSCGRSRVPVLCRWSSQHLMEWVPPARRPSSVSPTCSVKSWTALTLPCWDGYDADYHSRCSDQPSCPCEVRGVAYLCRQSKLRLHWRRVDCRMRTDTLTVFSSFLYFLSKFDSFQVSCPNCLLALLRLYFASPVLFPSLFIVLSVFYFLSCMLK